MVHCRDVIYSLMLIYDHRQIRGLIIRPKQSRGLIDIGCFMLIVLCKGVKYSLLFPIQMCESEVLFPYDTVEVL